MQHLSWPLRSFLFCFAAAYFWGVLSIQHYLPSLGLDMYINQYVAALLSLGLCIFFLGEKNDTCRSISAGVLLWFALLFCLLLQPLLNQIMYPDGLVFPIASVFLCLFLAWGVLNLNETTKQTLVYWVAILLVTVGLLTALSQVAQLMPQNPLTGILFFPISGNRLTGNIAQVNQAAFVEAMGICAAVYLFFNAKEKKIIHFFCAISVFFLAMGVALSASRGGMILAGAAAVSCAIFYAVPLRRRLSLAVLFVLLASLGYVLGEFILNHYLPGGVTAVGRFGSGEGFFVLRKALLENAWLAFQDNWLLGIGWGNFNGVNAQNFEEVSWFTSSHHAHNFIAQLAAELGVFGLLIILGFFWVLIRNFKCKLPLYCAFSYSVLSIIFLYSFSEFPLWYLRFLMLAAFFIAVIEKPLTPLSKHYRWLGISISALVFLGSIFYIRHYQNYISVAYQIEMAHDAVEENLDSYKKLEKVFGYGEYDDLMIYTILPVSDENLEHHIQLGKRVLHMNSSPDLLVKQANLLVLAGKSEEADRLYRAVCLSDNLQKRKCVEIFAMLQQAAHDHPDIFTPYFERFKLWYDISLQD